MSFSLPAWSPLRLHWISTGQINLSCTMTFSQTLLSNLGMNLKRLTLKLSKYNNIVTPLLIWTSSLGLYYPTTLYMMGINSHNISILASSSNISALLYLFRKFSYFVLGWQDETAPLVELLRLVFSIHSFLCFAYMDPIIYLLIVFPISIIYSSIF